MTSLRLLKESGASYFCPSWAALLVTGGAEWAVSPNRVALGRAGPYGQHMNFAVIFQDVISDLVALALSALVKRVWVYGRMRVRRGVRACALASSCVRCFMPKKRVNLYLNEDLYTRLRSVVAEVPTLSISGIFDQWMTKGVPALEKLLEQLKSGQHEEALHALKMLLADVNEEAHVSLHTMRSQLTRKEEPS